MEREKLNDMDSTLIDIEVSLKKASVVCNDLSGEYFGYRKPSESMLKNCYVDAETRNRIVQDYLSEMDDKLREFRKLSDSAYDCEKEGGL